MDYSLKETIATVLMYAECHHRREGRDWLWPRFVDLDVALKKLRHSHPELWPIVLVRLDHPETWSCERRLEMSHSTYWRRWCEAVELLNAYMNGAQTVEEDEPAAACR